MGGKNIRSKREVKQITIFEEREVRRTWRNEQWYFVIEDVILALIDSKNVKDYINKMRLRDPELSKGYGQIVHTLDIPTKGGNQKMNCANLSGIFRIIQSVPSPKAEPFKLWLAKVGQERIEEIQDPERAIIRAKNIYDQKGYSEDWIAKRMRGINVRNTLTDEWKQRGANEGFDFAILTNEIYQGAFDMTAKKIKEYKNLNNPDNPRDHMNELELILTMLGEATTTELAQKRNSVGLPSLKKDARDGGSVAGNARKDIEIRSGEKVVTKQNYLEQKQNKKLLGKKPKKSKV
ncbi:MAG: Bro-N domain-containing protein [bacterium]|nr:Bro-N domain-containing protein [bacterium]